MGFTLPPFIFYISCYLVFVVAILDLESLEYPYINCSQILKDSNSSILNYVNQLTQLSVYYIVTSFERSINLLKGNITFLTDFVIKLSNAH